jgi:hypothetical protein
MNQVLLNRLRPGNSAFCSRSEPVLQKKSLAEHSKQTKSA